jgi:Uracil DNA glycosylase superfamily
MGERNTLPVGGILVLGRDFGTVAGLEPRKAKQTAFDLYLRTEINLEPLLDEICRACGFSGDEVFLTNAWPCLRTHEKASGDTPGWNDAAFKDRCRQFFLFTLEAIRPRLILPLGINPTEFLAGCFPGEFPSCWTRPGLAWTDIGEEPFFCLGGTAIVPVLHPSYQHVNLKGRTASEYRSSVVGMASGALRVANLQIEGPATLSGEFDVASLREALESILPPYPPAYAVSPRIWPPGTFFPGGDGMWGRRNYDRKRKKFISSEQPSNSV